MISLFHTCYIHIYIYIYIYKRTSWLGLVVSMGEKRMRTEFGG
jgi:hypothetical protein